MLLRSAALMLALLAPLAAQQPPNPSLYPHIPVQRKAQEQPPEQKQAADQKESSEPVFAVQVRLVNVFTSVADEHGAPIGGLKKEDFRMFEDGVEQKVANFERESGLPLSIVLAMDTSMSTRKDLPLEIASARRFVHAMLRPQDAVSVFQFSTYVSQALGFTSDENRVESSLSHLRTGAATALYDAVFLAAGALEHRQGRKVIVLITDGGDTSSKTDYQESLRAAQIAEAIIYPIIMVPIEADAGRDLGGEHALIQLARDTGGKHYYATSPAGLDQAFRQISDELRTQYLLAYYPVHRAGGEFRRLRIELSEEARRGLPGELQIRHRAGYYNSKIE